MDYRKNKHLGLDADITRRDFVYGSALVAAALSGCRPNEEDGAPSDYDFSPGADWYGPGGVGEYAPSHGNTPEVVRAAHEIREGRFDGTGADAVDSNERYDLVVVGGGFAGMAAAHHFRRLRPDGRVLIIDNHPIFGGEAKRNEFDVDGVVVSGPQGSNDFGIQPETGGPGDYFTALNIPRDLRYVEPTGTAAGMRIPTDNFAFMFWQEQFFDVGHHFPNGPNTWVKDLWTGGLDSTPWSEEVRSAFARARSTNSEDHVPDGEELGPWLDSMTVRQYYENVLGMPREVSEYMDPLLASIIGLGTDAIGGWWGQHFALPGFIAVTPSDDFTYHSFPGGNAGTARYFVKSLIPDSLPGSHDLDSVLFNNVDFDALDRSENPVRFRLDSTVVRVEHEAGSNDRVTITYIHGGTPHRVTGDRVVMASGGWVNRHIVKDLPDEHRTAYESFGHSPILVANVALRNWNFMERMGVAAAMWQSDFGFACNIRRPMVIPGQRQEPCDPNQPIVLTFYIPFHTPGVGLHAQGIVGRGRLLSTSFAELEARIRGRMAEMFSDYGFDARRDIAGLILNRWGHAYANPGPGFQFGQNGNAGVAEVIRRPFGRIAIGHSELRGHQYWFGAAAEGRAAVEALLA